MSEVHNIVIQAENHSLVVDEHVFNVTLGSTPPSGGSGIDIYRHDQSTALSTWTINHNLGAKPLAQFFTDGGQEIETEWLNISDNQIQAFFNPARSGYALIKL